MLCDETTINISPHQGLFERVRFFQHYTIFCHLCGELSTKHQLARNDTESQMLPGYIRLTPSYITLVFATFCDATTVLCTLMLVGGLACLSDPKSIGHGLETKV